MRGRCGSSKIVIGHLERSVDAVIEAAGRLGVGDRRFPFMARSLAGVFRGSATLVDDGENAKKLETALFIVEELLRLGADRWDALIAIGGGSLLDTAGFAASIYKRGVDYVNVPTTLLAMVDASIGGKTGVDHGRVKNVIGSFHQPRLVLIDPSLAETLDARNYASGLAEVVKYGITLDADFFSFLESSTHLLLSRSREALWRAVARSAELKARVVEEDEREEVGKRVVLNFGHTVGHAVEGASNFSLTHGEAVAIGMKCELEMGVKLGVTDPDALGRYVSLCRSLGLCGEPRVDPSAAAELVSADKKRRGGFISIPLVKTVGSWELAELGLDEVRREVIRCLSTH